MPNFDQKDRDLIDNEACRQQLIDNWPMVQRIADKMARSTKGYWTAEELASFGFDGLLDAMQKYDPAKGSWLAYAKLRIRGAILDQMSVLCWHYLPVDRSTKIDWMQTPEMPDTVANRDHVRSLLNEVSPLTRQVLVMYFLCGYDQEKIGNLTGVTASAVSHRMHRGLRYLRSLHGQPNPKNPRPLP